MATEIDLLLAVVDLTDAATCLALADGLEEMGREEEATALRACRSGMLVDGRARGIRSQTQVSNERAMEIMDEVGMGPVDPLYAELNDVAVYVVLDSQNVEWLWFEGDDAPAARNRSGTSWV